MDPNLSKNTRLDPREASPFSEVHKQTHHPGQRKHGRFHSNRSHFPEHFFETVLINIKNWIQLQTDRSELECPEKTSFQNQAHGEDQPSVLRLWGRLHTSSDFCFRHETAGLADSVYESQVRSLLILLSGSFRERFLICLQSKSKNPDRLFDQKGKR